jgi:hypothetical protein
VTYVASRTNCYYVMKCDVINKLLLWWRQYELLDWDIYIYIREWFGGFAKKLENYSVFVAKLCEINKCADVLVNIDYMLDGDIIFYENCPKKCSHIVLAGILGITTPHLVFHKYYFLVHWSFIILLFGCYFSNNNNNWNRLKLLLELWTMNEWILRDDFERKRIKFY